jgi:hypothetical protein
MRTRILWIASNKPTSSAAVHQRRRAVAHHVVCVQRRGMWAFFQPLSPTVWYWMGAAMLLVPFIVVTFELAFKQRCDCWSACRLLYCAALSDASCTGAA